MIFAMFVITPTLISTSYLVVIENHPSLSGIQEGQDFYVITYFDTKIYFKDIKHFQGIRYKENILRFFYYKYRIDNLGNNIRAVWVYFSTKSMHISPIPYRDKLKYTEANNQLAILRRKSSSGRSLGATPSTGLLSPSDDCRWFNSIDTRTISCHLPKTISMVRHESTTLLAAIVKKQHTCFVP